MSPGPDTFSSLTNPSALGSGGGGGGAGIDGCWTVFSEATSACASGTVCELGPAARSAPSGSLRPVNAFT